MVAMRENWPPQKIALANDKRILFLTKDLGLIKQQLYDGLNLKMKDINPVSYTHLTLPTILLV